jgi:hypothetical protein
MNLNVTTSDLIYKLLLVLLECLAKGIHNMKPRYIYRVILDLLDHKLPVFLARTNTSLLDLGRELGIAILGSLVGAGK